MENMIPDKNVIEEIIRRMTALAMVYGIPQSWRDLYDADEALERGTIFRELDMPLETAMMCRRRIER